MIQAATEWIRAVLLVSFLATLVKLLLPDNSLRPFVRLVMGFVLLSVMVQPLMTLVGGSTAWADLSWELSLDAPPSTAQAIIASGQAITERGTQAAAEQVKLNVSRQIEAIVSLVSEVAAVTVEDLQLNEAGVVHLFLKLQGMREPGDSRVREILFKYFGIPESVVQTEWREEGESAWMPGSIG